MQVLRESSCFSENHLEGEQEKDGNKKLTILKTWFILC